MKKGYMSARTQGWLCMLLEAACVGVAIWALSRYQDILKAGFLELFMVTLFAVVTSKVIATFIPIKCPRCGRAVYVGDSRWTRDYNCELETRFDLPMRTE